MLQTLECLKDEFEATHPASDEAVDDFTDRISATQRQIARTPARNLGEVFEKFKLADFENDEELLTGPVDDDTSCRRARTS